MAAVRRGWLADAYRSVLGSAREPGAGSLDARNRVGEASGAAKPPESEPSASPKKLAQNRCSAVISVTNCDSSFSAASLASAARHAPADPDNVDADVDLLASDSRTASADASILVLLTFRSRLRAINEELAKRDSGALRGNCSPAAFSMVRIAAFSVCTAGAHRRRRQRAHRWQPTRPHAGRRCCRRGAVATSDVLCA